VVLFAKEKKYRGIIFPKDNLPEVQTISGIDLYPVSHINEILHSFRDGVTLPQAQPVSFSPNSSHVGTVDFADIFGQVAVKRALEIAAAGGHNILMTGSPGSGKTLLAQGLTGILPELTEQEAIEVTMVHSIIGTSTGGLIQHRPCRSPHHTISQAGLIGGGTRLRPGEISLAHHGVLFLDEFPEFSHSCLESLRQPMEDKVVHISRAVGTVSYPAAFMLVAASNPCPCGFRLSKKQKCRCTEHMIEKYQKRLSGPILDRIDLKIVAHEVEAPDLLKTHNAESSAIVKQRVNAARAKQLQRFEATDFTYNAQLSSAAIREFFSLTSAAQTLLNQAVDRLKLSVRGYFKTIKVAQTIADLSDTDTIDTPHIAEALQYRAMT
jgi:magnesium chelatase family protein